ncbi:response regulator transcription factor [Paenibacillus eucommiae]|uniref:DNA-binding NarL/FixJ family response regulator n=1 Tax=Paenibacillus eucommiae TaxID=1355755 RepID=A0ABS4IZP5_9BACL|nr:helix-turn-helix transcriptional regulator [Paenibacillus eucommiae]MBP1993067.1 DNA-binding NarL/FixJ family response regulator [Paenibacillus eucommiae]
MKNGDIHERYGTDCEHLNDLLTQRMGAAMQSFSNCYQITQRESEILVLIALHGFSNREIAEKCVITEKTVKNHLANIMKKLGIRSTRKLLSLLFNHLHYVEENRPLKVVSQ